MAIPDDLDRIEKVIREIGATLVIIDTLDDFVNCSTVNNQAVRRVLEALRDLAEQTQTAIILIRHFAKKTSGNPLFRGLGGVAITGVAHSQLKLYKHPQDEHLRVLIQDKNKLGPASPALLFEVVSTDDGQFRLECRGPTDVTIADLEKSKGAPKLEAAEAFLKQKLADGPKEVNWLVEQVKQAKDISKRHAGRGEEEPGNRHASARADGKTRSPRGASYGQGAGEATREGCDAGEEADERRGCEQDAGQKGTAGEAIRKEEARDPRAVEQDAAVEGTEGPSAQTLEVRHFRVGGRQGPGENWCNLTPCKRRTARSCQACNPAIVIGRDDRLICTI